MFVYRDETSMDARRQVVGSLSVSIRFMNSVESFRYEGSFFTCGCSHLSTNCEIGLVMLLQLGLIPIGFCVFFLESIIWVCVVYLVINSIVS